MFPVVLAFGTFDLFHKGHEFFLAEAAQHGRLHVAVARDAHVRALKGKGTSRPETARLATVARQPCVEQAVLSDETLGSYGVVRTLRPAVIALGHDQDALEADLRRWMAETGVDIPVVRIARA